MGQITGGSEDHHGASFGAIAGNQVFSERIAHAVFCHPEARSAIPERRIPLIGEGEISLNSQSSLTNSPPEVHLPAMLTRKHIELGAVLYIVLHVIVFSIYFFEVLQMMGFFGGK